MTVRKFEVKDGQAVMSQFGEFLHKNDIELKLLEKKRTVDAGLKYYADKDDSELDDWHKKYKYGLKVQSELIDNLLDEFE